MDDAQLAGVRPFVATCQPVAVVVVCFQPDGSIRMKAFDGAEDNPEERLLEAGLALLVGQLLGTREPVGAAADDR